MAHHSQSGKPPSQGGSQSTGSEVGKLGEQARTAASALSQRAADATSAVGTGMETLAGSIRDHGPQGGMLGTASDQVARTLESGGRYLKDEGVGGLMEDVVAVVRKNPIPAVLIGLGVGYLLARTTSRS